MLKTNSWALWLGPVAAITAAFLIAQSGFDTDMAVVGFVAVLCVAWWVFEPVPIPVTSLLPLAILPLLGVLTPAEVGQAYGSPLILLLLGGFILSKAMEHSGAHRRIALPASVAGRSVAGVRLAKQVLEVAFAP